MQPTLYGPNGRPIQPPMANVKLPVAPAVITTDKVRHNSGAEDEAIGRVVNLAAGTDRFLPVWFGRKIVGYVESKKDSRVVTFYKHPVGMKSLPLGFAGISTYDDIISALSAGRGFRSNFSKAHTTAPVISNFTDLWPVAGNPGAGAYGGTALTAKQFTDATAGAIYLNGNVEPTYQKYLLAAATVSSGTQPTLILYDRVLTYETTSFVASNQNFTNTLPALRYISAGQPGLNIAVTGQTVLGATVNQFSALTYTNQAGTAAQAMPTARACFSIASAAAPTATLGARLVSPCDTGGTVLWSQYLPMASGDTGARKLEAFTCSAANTGTLCFVLLRELMWIPMGTAGLPTQIDNVLQIGGLDRIYDGACLSMLAYWPSATASTFSGYIKAVWN